VAGHVLFIFKTGQVTTNFTLSNLTAKKYLNFKNSVKNKKNLDKNHVKRPHSSDHRHSSSHS
jgi:hypothetical protein